MVTNPAMRHGTDLLKYIFSFVIIASPSFRWFWGPPTQNHRAPCYRCWLVAYPAATDSLVLFALCFKIVFLNSADGKLLLTCRVVRHELHIAAGNIYIYIMTMK